MVKQRQGRNLISDSIEKDTELLREGDGLIEGPVVTGAKRELAKRAI